MGACITSTKTEWTTPIQPLNNTKGQKYQATPQIDHRQNTRMAQRRISPGPSIWAIPVMHEVEPSLPLTVVEEDSHTTPRLEDGRNVGPRTGKTDQVPNWHEKDCTNLPELTLQNLSPFNRVACLMEETSQQCASKPRCKSHYTYYDENATSYSSTMGPWLKSRIRKTLCSEHKEVKYAMANTRKQVRTSGANWSNFGKRDLDC